MAGTIPQQIKELGELSQPEIEARCAELYDKAFTLPSRREFVVVLLAYRLQERAHGGLNAATRKRLRALAAKIEAEPDGDFLGTPGIKPGARLVREWRGVTHKVTVVEDGFVHDGRRYKSLSEIARLITGTRWSGPLFFGLKKTPASRKAAHGG